MHSWLYLLWGTFFLTQLMPRRADRNPWLWGREVSRAGDPVQFWMMAAAGCALGGLGLCTIGMQEGLEGLIEAILVPLAIFLWLRVEMRAARPRLTYYRLALASALIAGLFVVLPARAGSTVGLGIVAWAGVTLLGLVWAITYERSRTNDGEAIG